MARFSRTLGPSILAALVVLIPFVCGDNSVHILSKYNKQLITSSTLNWLPISHYDGKKDIVIGGFEFPRLTNHETQDNQAGNPPLQQRSIYVCRALHNGVQVAGKQIEGEKRCTVTDLGIVASYERYDLLENVDNSARLSWQTWNSFTPIPVGAVAAASKYVARRTVDKEENEMMNNAVGYTHYIGTYDPNEGFGKITYVKNELEQGSALDGELLVETEPTYYELNAVKLNYHKKHVFKRNPRVLQEATIVNDRKEPAVLAEAFDYTFNYSIYWGQGHAMIKALNTTITSENGTRLGSISWGIEDKSVRSNLYTVKIRLEPGTAVNVTLRANYTDMEVSYSGELVSVYSDHERKSRMIVGLCREETMMDVTPDFGPIYFLNNMSLVPTTVAPPSTEAASTTTNTKPPEYTSSKETHAMEEATPKIDENSIFPQRPNEPSNIQSDDGNPLLLKNQEKGATTGAASSLFSKPNLTIIAISIIALYRIT